MARSWPCPRSGRRFAFGIRNSSTSSGPRATAFSAGRPRSISERSACSSLRGCVHRSVSQCCSASASWSISMRRFRTGGAAPGSVDAGSTGRFRSSRSAPQRSVNARSAGPAGAPAPSSLAACALLALWNVSLMKVAQDGQVRIGEPVSFGEAGAYQARVVHGWFGNPFTYPASLIFAARNGLPIGSYDLLAANRFLGDPTRPYGRVDIGSGDELLLGEGGTEPERDGSITFRWAATPATLLVPLDHAASLARSGPRAGLQLSRSLTTVAERLRQRNAGRRRPHRATRMDDDRVRHGRTCLARGSESGSSAVRACDATRRRRIGRGSATTRGSDRLCESAKEITSNF